MHQRVVVGLLKEVEFLRHAPSPPPPSGFRHLLGPLRALLWTCLKGWIRIRYPGAETMDSEALQALLATASPADWLILDARGPAEFACSHLPGAVLIRPGPTGIDPDIERMAGSRDRPILVVCSVGVRSARQVLALQRQGFERVIHLDGGLFAWVNRGHSLVRQGHPTQEVHPCNRLWGLLLQPPQ